MGENQGWAQRLRAAAVAVALAVGVAASIATTPPLEKCPAPTAGVEVSGFYGPQKYDSDMSRWATPHEVEVEGYRLYDVTVSAPGCVGGEAGSSTRVYVWLDFERRPTSLEPDRVFVLFTVEDGAGCAWTPDDVYVGEAQPARDGVQAYPAHANLVFLLPVDITGPVTLRLGPLGAALSLDPPDEPELT